jgi:magnesium transporter
LNFRRHRHAPGVAPGTYDTAQVRAAPAPRIITVKYDEAGAIRSESDALPMRPPDDGRRYWIHVAGHPSLELLEHMRAEFDLDPLALEDVVTVQQRPKFTPYDKWRFLTLATPANNGELHFEEISVFVAERVLISFFTGDSAILAPIHRRLERPQGNLARHDANFLFYALLDLSVDLLFPYLDGMGDELDRLGEEVLGEPHQQTLADIHALRTRLLTARRMTWATREVVSDILRQLNDDWESDRRLRPFLGDCYDHVLSAVDLIETYRDMATSLVEVHLSVISNRLNDVMRVLTVIATLFIPPTFVVGVYGMNFDRSAPWNMPELSWPFGYLAVMALIATMTFGMFVFFRRKRWI